MADLTYGQVLVVALVATVGFTFLAYGWSAYMARKDHSYQVRPKVAKARKATPGMQEPAAPAAPAEAGSAPAKAAGRSSRPQGRVR